MNESIDRAKAVQLYRDIKLARRMLRIANPNLKERNREKNEDLSDTLEGLTDRYRRMKKTQRTLKETRKLAIVIKDRIVDDFAALSRFKEFSETVTVGGNKPAHAKALNRKRKTNIQFHVGYLWHHRVWQTVHKDKRMTNDNIVVLEATEYRTNVPHIRLYEAKVYNTFSHKSANGWIGQSKLGKQRCAFMTDRNLAINEATKLAARAVDSTIKGEI